MCMCAYACVYVYVCACVCARTCVFTYVCVCARACVCACLCVYTYLHTNIMRTCIIHTNNHVYTVHTFQKNGMLVLGLQRVPGTHSESVYALLDVLYKVTMC